MLHRRKQQVLGLPPKQRRFHPITLALPEARGLDHRVSQVIDDYRQRVREGLVRSDAEAFAVSPPYGGLVLNSNCRRRNSCC